MYYKPRAQYYHMPLLMADILVALFVWLAENFSTFCAIWIYPSQKLYWHAVPLTKLGSWFLLMIISFVLVSLLHREDGHYVLRSKND